MKWLNITKGNIGNIAIAGCKIALCGIATLLPYLSKDMINEIRYSRNVKYSDVVDVILHGSMYSSDKNKVIELVKTDGDVEYYKSIIHIVNSSMYSCDKVKAIKIINNMTNVNQSEEGQYWLFFLILVRVFYRVYYER